MIVCLHCIVCAYMYLGLPVSNKVKLKNPWKINSYGLFSSTLLRNHIINIIYFINRKQHIVAIKYIYIYIDKVCCCMSSVCRLKWSPSFYVSVVIVIFVETINTIHFHFPFSPHKNAYEFYYFVIIITPLLLPL